MNFLNTLNNPVSLSYRLYRKFIRTIKRDKSYGVPHYYYCMKRAAINASYLGVKEISVLEFGVAAGSGLLKLEKISNDLEKEYPVKFQIYGFDLGIGMPEPVGTNDLPFVWEKGMYPMDQEELVSKLSKAKLVIGDIAITVEDFIQKYNPAPIAFISFDVDYYSSTISSFKIFNEDISNFLPRVVSYFDDVVSIEFVGQRKAIKDFNKRNERIKIGQELDVFLENKWI